MRALIAKVSWLRSGLILAVALSCLTFAVVASGADATSLGADSTARGAESTSSTADSSASGASSELDSPAGSVYITIYNDDLALVRDLRTVRLSHGKTSLSFSDIPSRIDATSVSLKSLTDPDNLSILEQNYEYDVISNAKLLSKYIGQEIVVTTSDGVEERGYLLSVPDFGPTGSLVLSSKLAGGTVVAIQADAIKTIRYPELPQGLVLKPTLVWDLANQSQATEQNIEVSYLTGGFSWSADYVATLSPDDTKADLIGWVTITNNSGTQFTDAKLKLMAGDVNRVQTVSPKSALDGMRLYETVAAGSSAFEERSLFEYHIYTLQYPTTLKNDQTKQIQLLSSKGVPVEKVYVYEPAMPRYFASSSSSPDDVRVMLRFKNSSENNLGMPLPKGRVRVNKADQDGSLEFVGEDMIDHTAKDEKVELFLGNAFDIVGERTQTKVEKVADRCKKEAYKIELRNHKDEQVSVHVIEPISSWTTSQILSSSHPYTRRDSTSLEFVVDVPANGSAVVTYEVLVTW